MVVQEASIAEKDVHVAVGSVRKLGKHLALLCLAHYRVLERPTGPILWPGGRRNPNPNPNNIYTLAEHNRGQGSEGRAAGETRPPPARPTWAGGHPFPCMRIQHVTATV